MTCSFRVILSLLVLVPLTGCSTTNLVEWAKDRPSVYCEPDGEFSRAMIKPYFTIVGFPIAVAWDVVTFPFQLIGGVHPYGSLMNPNSGTGI